LYHFKVIETNDTFLHCIAYGILADDDKGNSAVVPNISYDKVFTAWLAERCARGQSALEQLLDVEMDALLL